MEVLTVMPNTGDPAMRRVDRRAFLRSAAGGALALVGAAEVSVAAAIASGPATSPATRSLSMGREPLFGPYGGNAVPYISRFADGGANALWFHGFSPAAFEACAKHRIAACVEFKTFRADFAKRPELVPIGVDGQPIRFGRQVQGVCLSQHAFLKETEASLRAGVREFKPAGIWLDYLTYAGWFETPQPDLQESCFCKACVADFCQATGLDAEDPSRILEQHAARWTRRKCERIAAFAARYAGIIRAALPGCLVGAYMCPWTPTEFDGALMRIFAQDYDLLAPSIDVFTPLIYASKCGRPVAWAADFLEQSRTLIPAGRKVQLILDVLDFPASIEATAGARRPSWGLQLFGGADVFKDPDRTQVFAAAVARIRRAWARS
jgi:hypothetical protein